MTIIGKFRVSAEQFALEETLDMVPEAIIEIERVVASEDLLTPYFWVSNCELEAFETAAANDPSIDAFDHLDTYEETALYRADWTDRTDAIAFAYTAVDAAIVEATGQHDEWELDIRFDDQSLLQEFSEYCQTHDIAFTLERLYDIDGDRRGAKFGLTDKQAEALMTAWELGYFEEPRKVTLTEVGAELGIAKQSVARRLQRGHQTLIGNALKMMPPDESPQPKKV